MEFNDGQPRRVLILDAKYRANRRFGGINLNSSLPDNPTHPGNSYLSRYLNPIDMTAPTSTTEAKIVTDDWINTNIVKDNNTSKYNCDVWMTYKTWDNINESHGGGQYGIPAVAYCRSILIDEIPCDLPNIQILARIYCDAEIIDSMDSTIEEYAKYALGLRNSQGTGRIGIAGSGSGGNTTYAYNDRAWSSTEQLSGSSWYLLSATGGIAYINRRSECAIIPVLEL